MTFLGEKDAETTAIAEKPADGDCKTQCFVQTGTGVFWIRTCYVVTTGNV